MTKATEILANYLKKALDRHGAKAELARKSGVHPNSIDSYLELKTSPTLEQVEKMASALGIQVWEVFKPDSATPTQEFTPEIVALMRRIAKLNPAHRMLIIEAVTLAEKLAQTGDKF